MILNPRALYFVILYHKISKQLLTCSFILQQKTSVQEALNQPDDEGHTPIHCAASIPNVEVLSLFKMPMNCLLYWLHRKDPTGTHNVTSLVEFLSRYSTSLDMKIIR